MRRSREQRREYSRLWMSAKRSRERESRERGELNVEPIEKDVEPFISRRDIFLDTVKTTANVTKAGLRGEVAERLERAIVERSLLDFLDYVWLPDETMTGLEARPYQKWPHLLRLHEAAEAVAPGGTLPVGKARQRGITSYFEARFLRGAQYFPSTFFPVLSQGEKEASEFIKETRFMWERLPEHLKVPLKKGEDNTETLGFDGGGRIQAFPSTAKAGQSFTGTEVLIDEADFHEYFDSSYHTLLPILRAAGGKLFMVSTGNPDRVDSPYRQIWARSSNRLFIGYYDLPGITEADYGRERAQALDLGKFEKHNARNKEEFLAPPRASAYFDPDALQWMLANTVGEPMAGESVGMLSIWKLPAVGRHYILSADAAWGRRGSYTSATVQEWETAEEVATFHGRPAPNEAAFELVELHQRYNHAFMGIERAGEGQERDGDSVVVAEKVEALLRDCTCRVGKFLPRLYYHDNLAEEPKVPGWQTDGKSRPVMLGRYREAVRERQITVRCREAIQEMMTFIQNDKGRAEAAKGAYDDRVMDRAIGWAIRDYANFSISSSQSSGGYARSKW